MKLKLLQFWLDRDEVYNILYVAPDGRPIEEKDCLWDWAIRVSIDLTFNNQIDIVVQSGNQMAWLALLFQKKGYGYHDHELLSIYLLAQISITIMWQTSYKNWSRQVIRAPINCNLQESAVR